MTVNASLPPHLEQFVRDQVASGHFQSENEVILTALHLLEEKSHSLALRTWLKQEIDKGMWSKPSEPITGEFWKELRARFRDDAMGDRKALAERTHARLEKLRARYGTFSDSTRLIREDRDARG